MSRAVKRSLEKKKKESKGVAKRRSYRKWESRSVHHLYKLSTSMKRTAALLHSYAQLHTVSYDFVTDVEP